MLRPESRRAIPLAQLERLTGVMADALHDVYLIAALFAGAVMLLALRLPRGLHTGNAAH